LVDRPGKEKGALRKETRLYESQGYIVRRIQIDPSSKNYFIEARKLSNWLESIPHLGSRPPLSSLRRSLENGIAWGKVLSEDSNHRREIEEGDFQDGTMGRFLQDGLKDLDDLE